MIDLWVTQAVHLSLGQAMLLLALAITVIGLVVVYGSMEDKNDV